MKAISFHQANKVLKAPPSQRQEYLETLDRAEEAGLDVTEYRARADELFPPEQEVYDLPVWGGPVEGVERCISCWEPSPEERAAIAAGGPVWLWVVGATHPPLVLDAASPFEPKTSPLEQHDGPPADRILARLPAQRDDFHDIAEEYAIVAIDIPPGIMIWGRVENRWFANPSAREVVRQLLQAREADGARSGLTINEMRAKDRLPPLAPADVKLDDRPTVADSFQELLARFTLAPEEEEAVRVARIGASHETETLLSIIDRMTGGEAADPVVIGPVQDEDFAP